MGFVKSSLTLAIIHLCSETQYQQKQILERGIKEGREGRKKKTGSHNGTAQTCVVGVDVA